jgi:arsenate reductase (thioredoxin)
MGENGRARSSPRRILFVDVQNADCSQMAEALARTHGAGLIEAYSAGSRPASELNPRAMMSMWEIDCSISQQRPKALSDIPDVEYDVLVTMGCGVDCSSVRAEEREEWDVPDTGGMLSDEFRHLRNFLEGKVKALIERITRQPPHHP